MSAAAPRPPVALVLPGGGARTAYQAGVLEAIAEWLPRDSACPFPIVCGTSAGALNAALLASEAQHFSAAVAHLAGVWRHLRLDSVLRTDPWHVYLRGLHWALALMLGGLGRRNPRALLDARPLHALVERHINFARLHHNVRVGILRAVAITATGYANARSVTFVESATPVAAWRRERRLGVPREIDLEHVLASAALPFLFEAVRVGDEYYGDGSLRDLAPLSAAIHLGAERLLVIGTRNEELTPAVKMSYPSLGKIAGTILDALFSDSVRADLERLRQINQLLTLSSQPVLDEAGRELKPLRTLMLVPSVDLRTVATAHYRRFPFALRQVLRSIGALRQDSPLGSYVLFDAHYCSELVALGRDDARTRRDAILAFLGD